MNKLLRGASALAAIMAAAPMASHATEGWYARADAGYSVGGGVDFKGTSGPTLLNGKADHENDWLGTLGLGYAFHNNGLRLEGELGYRQNDMEPFAATTGSVAKGDSRVASAMINLFYDFNKEGSWQPYIGAGIGEGQARIRASSLGAVDVINDKDSAFAYQGMAGLAFRLSKQLSLDVGYKYFRMNDLSMAGTHTSTTTTTTTTTTFPPTPPLTNIAVVAPPAPIVTTTTTTTISMSPFSRNIDYDQNAVTLGLRWQFAAPPAPPPPVAPSPVPVPVCPAQDFKVYFEWDRSNLNASAQDTISAAGARAKSCNTSTVKVVGYTDTSGSAKYNIGLSNRRASVVRDGLVAAGIPAGLISATGEGETNLDKPTKDGVREPLNRRTAVTISFQ